MTTPSALSPDVPADAEATTVARGPLDREALGAPAEAPAPEQDPGLAEEDRDPPARTENELRRRLGLEPLEWALPRAVRIRGWVATAVVALIAALTRLIGLGHPSTLMFDEIYYVKDAYALWTVGYEAQWAEGSDALFAAGDFSGMSSEPSYVVHPQFGKWLIGLGMQALGADSPWGWRIVPAIAGIATVVLLARLTMRLTRSPLLAGLAGLLLAIDGVGITESRIGLLDVLIGFFATLTLYCLVRDREWSRARLARDLRGTSANHLAPRAHLRPWLWATGVSLGLTCSIKWSGLYLLAVVGILVVVWDTTALRQVRSKAWLLEGVIARGIGDFVRLVPTALVVYVALWWSWFVHDKAYKHGWAAEQRAAGTPQRSWLPDSLNDLLEYHQSMYSFHVGLDSKHPYESTPAGWLLQWRPTSFYWPSEEEMAGASCGASRCVQAITSIGNIPIWWAAILGLVVVLVMGISGRDWRAWVPLAGYLGLYVPWFQYPDRTIFTFYTVAFVPFVVLALTLALGQGMGMLRPVPGSREDRLEEATLAAGWIGEGRPAPRGLIARFLGFGPQATGARLPDDGAPTVGASDAGTAPDGVAVREASAQGPEAAGAAEGGGQGPTDAMDGYPTAEDTATATADRRAMAEKASGLMDDYPTAGTSLTTLEAEGIEEPEGADGAGADDGPQGGASAAHPVGLAGRVLRMLPPRWTGVPTWRLRPEGLLLTVVVVGLAVTFAILWWPIWTGRTVSYDFWRMHMLLDSWI
ncbi:dolichyl-phosphate-mannose--protein mannosyltransferase [Actinomyces bowdenii]|uniref:dolichyl-phosphate-mannose--protein mannosyltransferase n=1 Tax=Actinomyces bowdenii TaxID=131109 RepID=UPI003C7D56B6